jgi:ketosteroid isomerase-like protein
MKLRAIHVYSLGSLLALASASGQAPAGPILPGIAPPAAQYKLNPIPAPTLTAGQITLVQLEVRFAQSVAEGGGKAFATWFADDAVTLNNGKPATLGRGAIAASATWDPRQYQLTWTAQGAQMGPSGDMGFTWGHYEGHANDPQGRPVLNSGRYITVWRKLPDGTWKVAMDASADEPPATAECCAPPKP